MDEGRLSPDPTRQCHPSVQGRGHVKRPEQSEFQRSGCTIFSRLESLLDRTTHWPGNGVREHTPYERVRPQMFSGNGEQTIQERHGSFLSRSLHLTWLTTVMYSDLSYVELWNHRA